MQKFLFNFYNKLIGSSNGIASKLLSNNLFVTSITMVTDNSNVTPILIFYIVNLPQGFQVLPVKSFKMSIPYKKYFLLTISYMFLYYNCEHSL